MHDAPTTTLRDQIDGQLRLFQARHTTLSQQRTQLQEQARQIENQIRGTTAQLTALTTQQELIAAEITDQRTLLERGLAQSSRLSALHREDAITQLRDQQTLERELAERRAALRDRLSRTKVRSPVSGRVIGSQVFALRAVVQPAAPILFVAPQDQPLIVTARIDPVHIDQVFLDQPATLRFSSLDQRHTPEVTGRITNLSADALHDRTTGQPYFAAEVTPDAGDIASLGATPLLPGMPVQAFLKTGARSPLTYLTKPLTDYFTKAFRE